jgi:hypothetical protein
LRLDKYISLFITRLNYRIGYSMSKGEDLTAGRLASYIFGLVLLGLGLTLAYFSNKAEAGMMSLGLFSVLGFVVAAVGGVLILVREEND